MPPTMMLVMSAWPRAGAHPSSAIASHLLGSPLPRLACLALTEARAQFMSFSMDDAPVKHEIRRRLWSLRKVYRPYVCTFIKQCSGTRSSNLERTSAGPSVHRSCFTSVCYLCLPSWPTMGK